MNSCSHGLYLLFFFCQAEDGIRDYKVTGVQTCALPICEDLGRGHLVHRAEHEPRGPDERAVEVLDAALVERALEERVLDDAELHALLAALLARSEEHTSELQSPCNLVCRLLLEKKNNLI